jgi:FkbM family methyltransferase
VAQKFGRLGSVLFRIANYRRSYPIRVLARGCEGFLRCYNNVNYDFNSNGEVRLLRLLGSRSIDCVFDVGANVGDWLSLARQWCPKAHIHAFEIVPDTFAKLQSRSASSPAITLNPIGLAERPGRIDVVHCPDDAGLSSVISWPHGKPTITLSCEVTSGDDYCAAHRIDHIDLLKLDIEGAELLALRGFTRMLGAGAIDVIQFEYGYVNIPPKFLLKDLVEFLTAHGYVVGKMFPTYVDFKPYDLKDEDFQGPNYCAVRQGRPDLIALLG